MAIALQAEEQGNRQVDLQLMPGVRRQVTAIVTVALVVAALVAFFYLRRAERGSFSDLRVRIAALSRADPENRWFGFATASDEVLYFYFDDSKYYLGYEYPVGVADSRSRHFEEFAERLGLAPESLEENDIAVVRVRIDNNEELAAETAYRFAHELFGTEQDARLEFVP